MEDRIEVPGMIDAMITFAKRHLFERSLLTKKILEILRDRNDPVLLKFLVWANNQKEPFEKFKEHS